MGELIVKPIHNIHKQYRQVNLVNSYIFSAPFSYLLNDFPSAQIAYSFRKLRSAYVGNCIKVRRSSDNTTLDIGFASNVLDQSALSTFVGGGNGFIEIWYDQSGNANNMVQNTAANQPQIVISGVLVTNAGKPAFFSPKTAQMGCTAMELTYNSSFTVCKNELAGNDAEYMIPFGTTSNTGSYIFQDLQSGGGYVNWGLAYKNGNSSSVSPMTNGNFYNVFRTGNEFLISQFFTTSGNYNRGIGYNLTNVRGIFYVKEHITYGVNKTSDKSGIENNINAFYGIY